MKFATFLLTAAFSLPAFADLDCTKGNDKLAIQSSPHKNLLQALGTSRIQLLHDGQMLKAEAIANAAEKAVLTAVEACHDYKRISPLVVEEILIKLLPAIRVSFEFTCI